MNVHLAVCLEQVIDQETGAYGVNVVFQDGVATSFSPDTPGTFVRVGQHRAHSQHGSDLGLPRPGELGVVLEMFGGLHVWLCSLNWMDLNQVDPDPGLWMRRHDSGVVSQTRADGRTQWSHPSGLRLTVSPDGAALPELQRKGDGVQPPEEAQAVPCLELEHPSGLKVHVSKEGDVAVTKAKTLVAQVDGAASLDVGQTLSAKVGGDLQAEVSGAAAVKAGGAIQFESGAPSVWKAPEITLDTLMVKATGIIQAAGAVQANGGITTSSGGAVPGGLKMAGAVESASMKVSGSVEGASVKAGSTDLGSHKHGGVQSGGSQTTAPV